MNQSDVELVDGIIQIDTDRAKMFGFTSDKFSSDSYLWKNSNYITISFIVSLKKGNFKKLINEIINHNFGIKIPTPLPMMERIVRKCGYKQIFESDKMFGKVEIWVLEASREAI
jgi:hypothetical protein